jgi:hypothetical protein
VLDRVVEEVVQHLHDPDAIEDQRTDVVADRVVDHDLLLRGQGRHHVDRLADCAGELVPRALQPEVPALDLGHLEQVLDQPVHVLGRAADDLHEPVRLRRRQLGQLARRGVDPEERVPQIVRDDRHHVVASLRRLLRLAIEARVVHGEPGAIRQLAGQRQIVREITSRRGRTEQDRPEIAVARRERRHHQRLEPELAERVREPGRERCRAVRGLAQLDHTRLAGLEHLGACTLVGGVRSAGQRRAHERLPLRVGMRHREPVQLPAVVEEIHDAALREVRHREPRHARERGLDLQRAGEHVPGLGQEPRATLGGLGLRPGELLVIEPPQALLGALALDRVAHRAHQEPPLDLALDQVVLRADVHGAHREVLVVVAGEHHDRQMHRRDVHPRHRLQPLRIGQREIEEHHLERPFGDQLQRLAEPGDVDHVECFAGLAEQLADQTSVTRVVLDEQDS